MLRLSEGLRRRMQAAGRLFQQVSGWWSELILNTPDGTVYVLGVVSLEFVQNGKIIFKLNLNNCRQ